MNNIKRSFLGFALILTLAAASEARVAQVRKVGVALSSVKVSGAVLQSVPQVRLGLRPLVLGPKSKSFETIPRQPGPDDVRNLDDLGNPRRGGEIRNGPDDVSDEFGGGGDRGYSDESGGSDRYALALKKTKKVMLPLAAGKGPFVVDPRGDTWEEPWTGGWDGSERRTGDDGPDGVGDEFGNNGRQGGGYDGSWGGSGGDERGTGI